MNISVSESDQLSNKEEINTTVYSSGTKYPWLNDDIDKLIPNKIYRPKLNYYDSHYSRNSHYSIDGVIIQGKIKNYKGVAPTKVLNELRDKYNFNYVIEINGETLKQIIIDYSKILHQYGS